MFKSNGMGKILKAVLALATLVPIYVMASASPQEIDEAHNLKSELVIPHKDWGKKWQAGNVKGLFIVNAGNYSGSWIAPFGRFRETVELMNRFDVTGEAAMATGNGVFCGDAIGLERVKKLLDDKYDVYVLAGVNFNGLPFEVQYKILEPVCKDGKGLVILNNAGANDFMLPKRETKPLPAQLSSGLPVLYGKKPEEETCAFKFGRGRAVWVRYNAGSFTRNLNYSRENFYEFDYQMMQAGRAIQWAAGKAGRVQVEAEASKKDDGMPKPVFTLKGEETLNAKVSIEWRSISDNKRYPVPEKKVTVSPLGAKIDASLAGKGDELPAIPAGDYMVDIIVTSEAGTEAYGAIDVKVESRFALDKLTFAQDWGEIGDEIQANVKLNSADVPNDAKIAWTLTDCWGRVLDQREDAAAAENSWKFNISKFYTIGMRVEAALQVNGRAVSVAYGDFTVAKRQRGHFTFLQWDFDKGPLGGYVQKQLREAGYKLALITSPNNPGLKRQMVLADNDVSISTYSTRILNDLDKDGVSKNGQGKSACWNDEEKAQAFVDFVVNNQAELRKQGVFCYSLGDEGVTSGYCKHPACFERYKEYLKLVYGDIAALNASWGENYKDFSEVALLDPNDIDESKAIQAGKYSRWYDRNAFARWNLMQYSKRFVDTYKKLDPKAITGFEGTGGFKDDIELIASINTFYSPYPSIGDDILRGVADRSLIRANWMGYSKTGSALSDAAWRMVMKEMDSNWYWMWTGAGDWIGYLTPTFDYYPAIKDVKDEMAPIRNGLGDLLINLKTTGSGIAILYNLPSALASSLENGRGYVPAQASHEAWVRYIYQFGYDVKYISPKMLKDGVLGEGNFKMLLLPYTQAMSADEAKAIREFVNDGGCVVADVRPAIMDEHCNVLKKGALDDVFGIKRQGEFKPALVADLGEYSVESAVIDPNVAADTATAEGVKVKSGKDVVDVNVMFRNKFGKGQAVMMNFQIPKKVAAEAARTPVEDVIKGVLDGAGIDSPALLRGAKGDVLPFTETRIWDAGDAKIVGAWWQMRNAWFNPKSGVDPERPKEAVITLKEKSFVYDLRNGKFLGKTDKVNFTIQQGRACFFLIQPYKTEKVKLALAKAPARGDVVDMALSCKLPKGAKNSQAVKVEIVEPDGVAHEWASEIVVLKDGNGTFDFQVPFNAAAGTWKVRATELFSGNVTEASWKLK